MTPGHVFVDGRMFLEGGQPHKRRRTSEPIEIEDRLESLICRVGEKSTSSLESNLEGLAGVLEADLPNYKSKILRILCAVARLLPEKLTVYTTLVGLLNARNYNFGGEFVEAMIRQLKETLKNNLYNEAVYLVRSDWFVYVVLSCLPWVGKELYEKKDVEMDRLLSQYLDCLWAQIQKLKKDRWQERHILRPYIAFDSVLCEALQHNLPPSPRRATCPAPSTPCPGSSSAWAVMPGSHSVERFVIEENLHCIIKTHWKERKTCAAQLLSYPGKNKIPLNYHIVEVIFGELFQLPAPPHIDVMYTTLLIELCKLQPGSLPQLAQATEMMYMRLDTMNTTCIDRLINWFSHHLSNFQFRWSWDDWADCLTMDLDKPKPKFVKEVLEKYFRTIRGSWTSSLPPSPLSSPLSPFIYKYADESTAASLPGYATTITVGNAIKNRASNEEILTILKEVPNPNQEDDDDEGESFNPLKIDVFLQTLLNLAAKSFSHSFSALAKFHEILKTLAETDEGSCTSSKWFMKYNRRVGGQNDPDADRGLCCCGQLALLSGHGHEFTRLFIWEILHSTIRKMNKHVQKIQKELEEAKDKLENSSTRGDSGDDEDMDKNSEDEEGQLEEQIERLQEKVESAQSEQKNLFLVIFQRFIMLLTEHLVRCETGSVDISTPWYKNSPCDHPTVHGNPGEPAVTAELDHHILAVYQQFCALQL
ncbi:hypothetical protein INR49_032759 [Caranx melampygus]|nr:hypothetical protein INR49_032759 [Caranx melampygus]